MRYDATQKYHEFLSAITNYSAEGILAFGTSGRIILANRAVSRMLGYEQKELEGVNLDLILGSDEADGKILCQLFDTKAKKIPPLALSARRKGGGEIPIEIAVSNTTLADGEKVFVANCRDITERLLVEGRLISQAEIINRIQDGIAVADAEFRISECNRSMAELAALQRPNIVGKSFFTVFDVQFEGALGPDKIKKIALDEGRWGGIVDLINNAGMKIKADIMIFPVTDSYDMSTVFTFVVRDVTARVESEDRINQTQKIEALGRLAGGVAHDVNNLLFPIFLNLETALEDLHKHGGHEETCEDIKDAMEACLKIKTMIQHILLFSRKNSVEVTGLDLGKEMIEAWKLAKLLVPSSLRCDVDIGLHCGEVTTNSVQLSQIVLNLVSNAVAAMGTATGTLKVSLNRVSAATIAKPKYYKLRQDDVAVLTVADTGHGISTEHVEKIFEPFFTTKEVGQGTGLGLTEVAGIVKSLNGAINVESTPDVGTVFNIYFPVH